MSVRDPIKEIFDEYQEKIASLKKERDMAIENFREVLRLKKIEDIKSGLKINEVAKSKK